MTPGMPGGGMGVDPNLGSVAGLGGMGAGGGREIAGTEHERVDAGPGLIRPPRVGPVAPRAIHLHFLDVSQGFPQKG